MARSLNRPIPALAARLVAIPASYALASLASACLARLLPLARVEAATAGMLVLFGLCAVLILWVFSARNIWRVWLWFAASTFVLGTILLLSLLASGRA